MDRNDRDDMIFTLRLSIAAAHNDARGRAFSEDEQRRVWHDPQLQERMTSVRATTIEFPIEFAEIMLDLLSGDESIPRGHHATAVQRALRNLAKAEYEKRMVAAKAAGVRHAKDMVLDEMGVAVGLSADRISQIVWPRRGS